MSNVDLERGSEEVSRPSIQQRNSAVISPNPQDQENPHLKSELEIFQTLVGIKFLAEGGAQRPDVTKLIQPASPMADIFRPTKTSQNRFRNRGLYDRALSQDLKNRVMYTISHYIITSLYILQIMLAATITALAASEKRGSMVALTILGGLNTVVAGVLAWLTGQGIPARYRSARDQYREVVKAIEKAERLFAEIDFITWAPGQRPNPVKERDKLEERYEEARLDEEANYPERQQSPSAVQKSQKNEEKNQQLQDKIGKNKIQKDADKIEIETMRKELESLRSGQAGPSNVPK